MPYIYAKIDGMLPGFDLIQFSHSAGLLAAVLIVAFIIFAESGLLIGFFLPGDSMLFTLGFLLQSYRDLPMGLNVHIIATIIFIAAAIGDSTGYAIGRRYGPRVFNKKDSLLFKRENIERSQKFYDKYGGKAIVLARFVPIIRTFAPVLAGVGKMKYKHFVFFNILGAALWSFLVIYAGYFLGSWLKIIGIDIDAVILPIVALILIVSIIPAAYQFLKTKEQRENFWKSIKKVQKTIKDKIKR